MKTIYCIRHGKSTHNVSYEKNGPSAFMDPIHEDANLVEKGIEQSITLADTWINKNDIEIIITSPLLRTLDTTFHIFKSTNIPIIVLDDVREFPLGSHVTNKRKSRSKLEMKYPLFNFSDMYEDATETTPETKTDLSKRVIKFKEYLNQLDYKNIALVSHSSFLKEFLQSEKSIDHCNPIKYQI